MSDKKQNSVKKCIKCGLIKKISEYNKRSDYKNTSKNTCKKCIYKYNKEYRIKNKELLVGKAKLYYIENKECIDESNKLYYIENREEISERQKVYYEDNKECISERQKVYYEDNKECISEKAKLKRKKNPEVESNYRIKNKEKSPHIGSWRTVLKSALRRMNLPKSKDTIDMLGYSANDLKLHMESLFIEGMSWDNHGEWHIDHKIPVSTFRTDAPMSIVNSLENLQPLWSGDNLSKGNKIYDEYKTMYIYKKYCIK